MQAPQPLRNNHPVLKALCLGLAIGASSCAFAAGSGAAQQLEQWAGDRWVTRSISLGELGFTSPAVLDSNTARREYYLPVPANVPLSDAAVQLNARYLRADGGRTSMTLSIDGYPVAARRFTEEQGDASQAIGIDGLPRSNGFVRLGVNWSSVLSDQVCTDQRAPGNSLRLAADSRFSYRYERAAIKTLATGWSALPVNPVLLVSRHGLSTAAYDTAWRTGVALQRNGKHVSVSTLPAVGDAIDLSALSLPPALLGVPAFAALNDRAAQHRIKDQAELGALIALGQHGPLHADLVIADSSLIDAMRTAVAALQAQIKSTAADAAAPYAAWLASGFTLLDQTPSTDQLRLATFGGNSVIVIPATAGAKAAGLLGTLWQSTAVNPAATVKQASAPKLDGDKILLILLNQFGALAGSMDVLAHAERSVTFDLGSVAVDGRLPAEIVFDLSAAPSINGEAPVISVFLNDFLLGAKRLTADGRPQRVSVPVPAYTLAARNEIRIAFYRQPTQERCHDQPSAFPVSILPGSHIRLSKSTLGRDFVGTAGHFADSADLLISDAALATPGDSLPQVIRIAEAVGFSTDLSALRIVKTGQTGKPEHAFLAFDVALDGDRPAGVVRDGKLVLKENDKPLPMLELADMNRLATVEVLKSSDQIGILYRNIGTQAPTPAGSFRLTRGNFAVVGDNGLLLQIDTNDPTGSELADASNPQSMWEKHMTLWLIIIGALAFALIAARVAQVRRRARPDSAD
ncbi:cellulose biosynthesis cyclic di-GMP-binding regulatory protein BcsB [Herbaspirillum sp. RV1423]|uniref:cellulose biosynthesis cyclic di-GMP-binding regulatory protein BcsB n=1 Tax=Herbaspirillum sp. RV1423 TaxID=1443993 RepID=UPI0004AF7347|nr:cellulose biosynthesis cyclic di-GMP-binding regulatory protein BcsB [Herbaspirillum sp. RV1423]